MKTRARVKIPRVHANAVRLVAAWLRTLEGTDQATATRLAGWFQKKADRKRASETFNLEIPRTNALWLADAHMRLNDARDLRVWLALGRWMYWSRRPRGRPTLSDYERALRLAHSSTMRLANPDMAAHRDASRLDESEELALTVNLNNATWEDLHTNVRILRPLGLRRTQQLRAQNLENGTGTVSAILKHYRIRRKSPDKISPEKGDEYDA